MRTNPSPPTPESSARVVILNDTSTRYHHGCATVMEHLEAGLQARGLQVTARSRARNDWTQDAAFLALMAEADLVVVNGEGTIHHGRAAGKLLLDVAGHGVNASRPCALVNALYEANPVEWADDLARFDLISLRDQASFREVSTLLAPQTTNQASPRDVRYVPDLSMAGGPIPQSGPRDQGLVVGDSVRWNRRRDLARAAQRLRAQTYLPIKTLSNPLFYIPVLGRAARWLLYNLYNGVLAFRQPGFVMARDRADYLARLGRAEGHVTGRFHSVCLSMVTGTPFVAMASNARKIEALLTDAGLDHARILSPQALERRTALPYVAPFSPQETAAILAFLDQAQRQAQDLFDALAALAQAHARHKAQA